MTRPADVLARLAHMDVHGQRTVPARRANAERAYTALRTQTPSSFAVYIGGDWDVGASRLGAPLAQR
jgi:hypothetical protein